MRSMAMMVTLSVASAACGMPADQRMEMVPEADAVGGDVEARMSEPTSSGEAVGEAKEDLGMLKIIHCNPDEEGAACERKYDAAGIWCPSAYGHPFRWGPGRVLGGPGG